MQIMKNEISTKCGDRLK